MQCYLPHSPIPFPCGACAGSTHPLGVPRSPMVFCGAQARNQPPRHNTQTGQNWCDNCPPFQSTVPKGQNVPGSMRNTQIVRRRAHGRCRRTGSPQALRGHIHIVRTVPHTLCSAFEYHSNKNEPCRKTPACTCTAMPATAWVAGGNCVKIVGHVALLPVSVKYNGQLCCCSGNLSTTQTTATRETCCAVRDTNTTQIIGGPSIGVRSGQHLTPPPPVLHHACARGGGGSSVRIAPERPRIAPTVNVRQCGSPCHGPQSFPKGSCMILEVYQVAPLPSCPGCVIDTLMP